MSALPFVTVYTEPAPRSVSTIPSTPLMRAAQELLDAHDEVEAHLDVLDLLIDRGGSEHDFTQANRDLSAAQGRITRARRSLRSMLPIGGTTR